MTKITKIISRFFRGAWGFSMMNSQGAQSFMRSYFGVFMLILVLLVFFERVDFHNKQLYKEYRALSETRDKIHNVEMSIGKEYFIKTSEEYIFEEVLRRELPLKENVKPPIRIEYDE